MDSSLLTMQFACDLAACKGACCTMPGGSGAPVTETELPILESAWELVRKHVPKAHSTLVERKGLFLRDAEGWTIRCLDHRACVFVLYENEVAKCAIHQAYQRGEFGWPKPASCHLFPLRVRGKRRELLEYEEYPECSPALLRGSKEGMSLYAFLEEPIRRVFGDEYWSVMQAAGDSFVKEQE